MREAHYENILAKQLAMNRQTWAALQQHGVTEEIMLRLDFSYNPSSREAAEKLRFLLQEETDYELELSQAAHFCIAVGGLRGQHRRQPFLPRF
jgi:hypothetical protein